MRKLIIYLDEKDGEDISSEINKGNIGLYDTHESKIYSGEGIHLNANGEEIIAIEIHLKPCK